MINAQHYCKFVKVNGPLSPVSAPTSELQVSPLIVSAALSWRLRVTPPHVDPRDAPGRFARGASETLGSFLQLQIPLADTVATTPFMWLSEKTRENRQRYARLTVCYYRCAVLCVHAESGSSFNLPQCMTALHTQAAHSGSHFS